MTPKSPLKILAALLLATQASAFGWDLFGPTPDPGTTHEGVFTIDFSGESFEFSPSPAGQEAAAAYLAEKVGPGYQGLTTWRVVELLCNDGQLLFEIESAATLSKARDYHISLNPADSRNQIFVGETLALPGNRSYTVVQGDTLGEIADAEVATPAPGRTKLETLMDLNYPRFEVWPHQTTEPMAGGTWQRPVVRIGESEIAGWSDAEIKETLVHEFMHVGDVSHCSGSTNPYGPDQTHYDIEVITPAAAFIEGIAVWRGMYAEGNTQMKAKVEELEGRLPQLMVEVSHSNADDDGYEYIACSDLNIHDLMGSELWVARLLWVLGEESGLGRLAVSWALEETDATECRTVADLIGAYVKRFPEQRGLVEQLLVKETHGLLDDAQLEDLMKGRTPEVDGRRVVATHPARSPNYDRSGDLDRSECEGGFLGLPVPGLGDLPALPSLPDVGGFFGQ